MAGITPTNRTDGTTERKLIAKVYDNFLETPTLISRLMGRAKNFSHKTIDYTLKIKATEQGQWFSGMPTLNSSATDTTVTVSYPHAAYSHPITIPIEEAFANVGQGQTIPLVAFKTEEAHLELLSDLGSAAYGTGQGDYPNGLGNIVDDGSVAGTIGTKSRTTYSELNATKTASGGKLTLNKMATLWDAIVNGSTGGQALPTVMPTTPTIFSLYEQLLHPTVRMNIDSSGYSMLPIRGDRIVKAGQLLGAGGFNVLSYRGVSLFGDSYCTDGYLYMINENTIDFYGRSVVPSEFSDIVEKVTLGEAKTIEGQDMMPSKTSGVFRTKFLPHPDQPGMISRLFLFGNITGFNFRRNGVLTGIDSV